MSNRVVWDEKKNAFYETWYFTVNHRASGKSFWLRSTLNLTPDGTRDQFGGLWCAMFDPEKPGENLAFHRMYPESSVCFGRGGLDVVIGESRLREGQYRAEFANDSHFASWDLHYKPHTEDIWLVPKLIRGSHIPKADVCVPNVDIELEGELTIDGETYRFEGDPAGQAHHWGYHYAREWLWGHCNDFENSPGAWLEVLAVKLFDWGRASYPVTLLQLNAPSGRYGVRTPLQLLHSRACYEKGIWRYVAIERETRIEVEFSAPESAFVCFPYTSPHNESFWCHNSCLCDLKVQVFARKGNSWVPIEQLVSKRRAAAEFCTMKETTPSEFVYQGVVSPRFIP